MKKNNIVLSVIAIIMLLCMFAIASYAFFDIGNLNITNVTNFTATSERNNMVFDSLGGIMELNVTAINMSNSLSGSVAAENTAILTVNFQANTSESMVCSYDIMYEWTSTDKYQVHSNGVTENEYTIKASLTHNDHVSEGVNHIANDLDLSVAVGSNNSAIVVSGAQIDSTGTATNTAVWTISSKFFNVDADQDSLSGKSYKGRFKVVNVSCVAGTRQLTLVEYLVNSAPKSGTSTVGSAPWVLTSDRTGEWRYAGKNPDNYVQFNGELWRIIGVMPYMTYCTGTLQNNTCSEEKTSSLVKIMRNTSEGKAAWNSSATNNWSSAALKTTLQGKTYASNNLVATAKWSLYGINSAYSTSENGSAAVLYNRERNINGLGLLYSTNPAYWYGKVGLMYPSDYVYATNGGSTYSRDDCNATSAYNWGGSDAYNTDCATNSWVMYSGITSSAPSTKLAHWFLTPAGERADYSTVVRATGQTNRATVTGSSTYYVHPVVYLKAETLYAGSGTGAWNSPYTIN